MNELNFTTEIDENTNFYIRVKDGVAFEYPIFESNLFAVLPDFDPNNLPEGLVKFKRKPFPEIGPFQVLEDITFEPESDYYTDCFHIREMTPQEREEKIAEIKSHPHFPLDIFNETLGIWEPLWPNPSNSEKIFNYIVLDWVNPDENVIPSWVQHEGETWLTPPVMPPSDASDDNLYWWSESAQRFISVNFLFVDTPNGQVRIKVLPDNIQTIDDLDSNYNGNVGDSFLISDTNNYWSWSGLEWKLAGKYNS